MKNFKQKKNSPKRSDTVSIPTWAAPVVGPIAGLAVGGMMVLKMARRIEPGAEPLGP